MTSADWLLLFIAQVPRAPIDPVRLQKGLFLLAQSGRLHPSERYEFEPYSYGPMSRAVYRDLRVLERARLVRSMPSDHAWAPVTATTRGQHDATRLRSGPVTASALGELGRIRRLVDSMTFADLLEHVYARHPEYAVRSVFRR